MKKIVSLSILVIFLSGCTALPARRTTERGEVVVAEKQLSTAADLRFEDVPTPAGFGSLRDQSFIFQDSTRRVGFLRYTGRADASQVITFFKSQMPVYNWQLQNVLEHGIITMNFTKDDESCVITIEPLATRTLVDIILSPKTGTVSTGFGFKK